MAAGVALTCAAAAPCRAGAVDVADAVVPATPAPGADVPLLMRITNHAAETDALLRVRCPFANFSERQTVDYGEGAPANRAVPAIPLPAGGEVLLSTGGYHVMLLQTREPLVAGQSLTCAAAFRNAGALEINVRVTEASPH
jgi:copper(I)-binding protein